MGSTTTRAGTAARRARRTTPAIEALRAPADARTSLRILLLSQGVPMLLGGDEMRRTQRGNNNAYCQDNAISWFDWGRAVAHAETRALLPEDDRLPRAPPNPAA